MKWIAILAVAVGVSYCSFRPVCVPLSSEDVARFDPPIERRDDRNFYITVFQQRDGQWHQCKPWLARQFFF
jgi:hypothetical protein